VVINFCAKSAHSTFRRFAEIWGRELNAAKTDCVCVLTVCDRRHWAWKHSEYRKIRERSGSGGRVPYCGVFMGPNTGSREGVLERHRLVQLPRVSCTRSVQRQTHTACKRRVFYGEIYKVCFGTATIWSTLHHTWTAFLTCGRRPLEFSHSQSGFKCVQHVRPNRGPTNRAPQRPENVGRQRDIFWSTGIGHFTKCCDIYKSVNLTQWRFRSQ